MNKEKLDLEASEISYKVRIFYDGLEEPVVRVVSAVNPKRAVKKMIEVDDDVTFERVMCEDSDILVIDVNSQYRYKLDAVCSFEYK